VPHPARGFSLVELIVVVAVIVLLSGILLPVVSSQIDDAKNERALADLDLIAKAFSTFRAHTSMWPGSHVPVDSASVATGSDELTDFRCLYANATNVAGWKGPYLNQGVDAGDYTRVARTATSRSAGEGLLDPWGQPYRIYRFAAAEGDSGAIVVLSRGPDAMLNSSPEDVNAGVPSGDDVLKVISRRL
jgi:general secretion pathway protein G